MSYFFSPGPPTGKRMFFSTLLGLAALIALLYWLTSHAK